MPVSKKRKRKDGAVAKFKRDRHEQRRRRIQADVDAGAYGTDSGVSLQDLINVVAYQEYQEKGLIVGPKLPDSAPMTEEEMLKAPEAEAVIRALDKAREDMKKTPMRNDEEENEDGRQ